jgi:translocation and assembly module TamB
MTETAPSPRTRRRKIWQAMLGLLLICFVIWAAWFFTSSGFREFVRGRLEARVEQVTGGKTEIRAFRWNLSRMEFEAEDVTVHGTEPSSEKPFAHVDRLFAHVKILSFLQRKVDLELLSVTHPVIHLIVYPDGTTNQPVPKKGQTSERNPVEQLIDLAVGKLELQQAELILNQQSIPIHFQANDVAFSTKFDHSEKRYDGSLSIGKAEGQLDGWRPLAATAQFDFSLFRDHIAVRKLELVSGKSKLAASGEVKDLQHLAAELTYNARIDLKELAGAARLRSLTGGTLELQGAASIAPQGSATRGQMKFNDLGYSDGDIHLSGVNGRSGFSIDRTKMAFTSIAADALGGKIGGKGEIRDWAQPAKQVGSMNFDVEGVALRQVAEAATTRDLPLTELHYDGTAGGSVRLSWTGPFNDSQTRLAVVVLPTGVHEGLLAVTAELHGTLFHRTQTLQIDSLHLATPSTDVVGKGAFNAYHAELQVQVHSKRSADFMPIISAMRRPDATPLELNGPANFNGTIAGRLSTPTVMGHVELRDFVTLLPENLNAKSTRTQAVHWDSLVAELRYAPAQLSLTRATITRGRAQVNSDFTATLDKGTFTDSSIYTVRANVRGAEINDLQESFGLHYPVSGRLDTAFQAMGPRKNLQGNGHLQVNNATVYGEPNCSASADIQFAGNDLQVSNARAGNSSGEVSGSGAYNLQNSTFHFNLKSGTIQLVRVQLLRKKRIDVEGTATFEASGTGTTNQPSVNARLHFRDLAFSGERAGALDIDAVTQGEVMTLKGVSDFQNASVQFNGDIRMREKLPSHLVLTFNNLDIDPLIGAYLKQFRMTSHTLMAGRAEMNGTILDPRRLELKGAIDSFVAGLENVKVASRDPILFSVKDQVVHVDAFHLVGEGTDFTATGQAALTGDRALEARADGRINMRILQSFSPEYNSSGLTTINLNLRGTVEQPRVRGRIQISDGAISYVDLPNGLSGINGTLIFTEDRLQVQKLSAHTGGGDLDIGGFIAYRNGLTFTLTAHGKDIRLRYPPGVSASGDAELTLAGTPKNSLLSGDITVTRFGLNPKFDFASYLAKGKQPQLPVSQDSPLNGLRLDIHVVSTPELQLETSLAKVTGNIDLHLRGTAARPVLLGRLNIFEGDIIFNSTTYHLERGEITFNNPAQIQPVLDVEASAHVRDYDITLGFHGPADRPSISYRSDPPLPTADIIALLALGRTRQESATAQMYNPQQTTLTQSDENALLGQALNATVSSRVQRLFGVSRIKIDPQVGGPENNANARLTIEQQVSNKITITYITNLSQSAQQIIQVEWNITRDLSVQGIRDQTGVLGFDVRIRQRKK